MDDATSLPFGEMLKAFRKREYLTQQQLARTLGVHYNTIGGWERGDSLPDKKGIVLELAKQLHLDHQESCRLLEASLTAPAPYWNIPLPRNPFFTGREDVLDVLSTYLGTDQDAELLQSYAIHGLGGIGKTHLAVEYAYRHALEYVAVFWMLAESAETIIASFLAIAELLHLPERQQADQQRVVAAVQHWLSTHGKWLLIWDNLEQVALLRRYFPVARSGVLLITTRALALGELAQCVEVLPMTQEDGSMLLLRRAKLLPSSMTSIAQQRVRSAAIVPSSEYRVAQEVASLLGGLPLALDQAGAYIEASRCSVSDYLRLFQAAHLRLLDEREAHMDHPLSVMRTFSLAFEQLGQSNQEAADLLIVCSFLSSEAIPESFFLEGAAFLGDTFERLVADPFGFQEACKALLKYALIQRDAAAHTLTVHRLVQIVLQGQLAHSAWQIWMRRVITAMIELFPSDEEMQADYWQTCECLLPHALVCVTLSERLEQGRVAQITLTNHIATYLSKRARYGEATALFERAWHLGERALGPEHPLVAETLYRLAELHRFEGNYGEAEALFQRALHIRERALGSSHLLVTDTLDNLGVVSYEQGKYEQAEMLLERALQVWESTLGSEHPKVARSLNNLGMCYWREGKYQQAQPVYQRALQIRERALGPEHFQVGTSLDNLAYLYLAQGNYEQARPLFERALQIWQQALGAHHLQIAYPLHGLAKLYAAQGQYEQARPLYEQALTIGEQALGPEHPIVAEGLNSLGELSRKQGRYTEAEALYQRALQIWQHTLGTHHPQVASALHGLALIYKEQGQGEAAVPVYQRALQIREQALGAGHLSVAELLIGLGEIWCRQDRYEQAAQMYRRALSIQEQALGSLHPRTVATRSQYVSARQNASPGEGPFVEKPEEEGSSHHPGEQSVRRMASSMQGRAVSEPFQEFLHACCDLHPHAWCRSADLWYAYQHWAKARGERYTLSQRRFLAALKTQGCQPSRTNTSRIWRGITLKASGGDTSSDTS